jgi:O-antigen/teichoic acid export membrane protein
MVKDNSSSQNLSKLALKGSAYNVLSLLVLKFGGLIFTIILARMLLPELFGIYALAISIVTLALSFTDLGMENTFLRYLSDSKIKKDKKKSRGLSSYFFKLRFILIIVVVIILIVFSKYLSYNIYKQPLLFYPLIFSCLFIIAESFRTLLNVFFFSKKDVKSILFFDSSSQILKILFSVFAILILSDKLVVSGIFVAFFVSSFFTLLLEFFIMLRKDKSYLFGKRMKIESSKINLYWRYMALATVSLSFFALVDTLMLGAAISSEYLAYYRSALSLAIAISSLLSLSSIFLPIFTQIDNKRFERGFKKTLRYLLILSIPAMMGVVFLSKYLIKAVYGNEYLLGTSSLYLLSILIVTAPLIGLYSIILESKEKSNRVGNSVLISLILNIILNFIVIKVFSGNPLFIIGGVSLATSLSRVFLLGLLVFYVKKEFGFAVKGIGIKAPLCATIIMGGFLWTFNYLLDINIFLGILEVVLGAIIYLGFLILFKGVTKEDWLLLKGLI